MKRYIKSAVKDIGDEDYDTQSNIALDKNTPPEDLERLYNLDGNLRLMPDFAHNPNCPPEILEEIALKTPVSNSGYNISIFDGLATNPNTPTSALLIMAKKCDWYTINFIIKHPNTTYKVLEAITKSGNASPQNKKLARQKMKE